MGGSTRSTAVVDVIWYALLAVAVYSVMALVHNNRAIDAKGLGLEVDYAEGMAYYKRGLGGLSVRQRETEVSGVLQWKVREIAWFQRVKHESGWYMSAKEVAAVSNQSWYVVLWLRKQRDGYFVQNTILLTGSQINHLKQMSDDRK